MGGNPNWWAMHFYSHQSHHQQQFITPEFAPNCSSSSFCSSSFSSVAAVDHLLNQNFPVVRSSSHLFLSSEEDNKGANSTADYQHQHYKKPHELDWPELNSDQRCNNFTTRVFQHAQPHHHPFQFHDNCPFDDINTIRPNPWHLIPPSTASGIRPMLPPAPPGKQRQGHHQVRTAGNDRSNGAPNKKARVHQSSAKPVLKVRKEKLGDRITALHQLVSPFGKTDTASVLSEAISHIRFLQGQIEAFSTPYMRSGTTFLHQHSLLNSHIGIDGRPIPNQESAGVVIKDLRSRGLCLVPIASTRHVADDIAPNFWPPPFAADGYPGF